MMRDDISLAMSCPLRAFRSSRIAWNPGRGSMTTLAVFCFFHRTTRNVPPGIEAEGISRLGTKPTSTSTRQEWLRNPWPLEPTTLFLLTRANGALFKAFDSFDPASHPLPAFLGEEGLVTCNGLETSLSSKFSLNCGGNVWARVYVRALVPVCVPVCMPGRMLGCVFTCHCVRGCPDIFPLFLNCANVSPAPSCLGLLRTLAAQLRASEDRSQTLLDKLSTPLAQEAEEEFFRPGLSRREKQGWVLDQFFFGNELIYWPAGKSFSKNAKSSFYTSRNDFQNTVRLIHERFLAMLWYCAYLTLPFEHLFSK